MKKKIVLMVVVFMMVMGTVVGGSLYGEYKGNPIVKVKSDGKTLVTEDTPAVMLDGRTMVPIYMLRELGAEVSWDGETQSVDVTLPIKSSKTSNSNLGRKVVELSKSAKDFGVSYFNLGYDEHGSYVNMRIDSQGNVDSDLKTAAVTSILSLETDASEVIINFYSNNQQFAKATISRKYIKDYLDDKITEQEFMNKWTMDYAQTSSTSNYDTGSITNTDNQYEEISNIAMCSNINDKYDDEINKLKADLNSRGILNSSILDARMSELNEQRKQELSLYGCN
jgi:hypothetical protein